MILLDMNLPEIDGWEVARTLKDAEPTRDIPIIALTAHAMSGDREKAIGAGCDDYHTKPAELTRLVVTDRGDPEEGGRRLTAPAGPRYGGGRVGLVNAGSGSPGRSPGVRSERCPGTCGSP